jgi:hypothetical protein
MVHISLDIQEQGVVLAHVHWEKSSSYGENVQPTHEKEQRPSRFQDLCRMTVRIDQAG